MPRSEGVRPTDSPRATVDPTNPNDSPHDLVRFMYGRTIGEAGASQLKGIFVPLADGEYDDPEDDSRTRGGYFPEKRSLRSLRSLRPL